MTGGAGFLPSGPMFLKLCQGLSVIIGSSTYTNWWFQIFFGIFTSIWGRRTHFDIYIFQMGWLKPPTMKNQYSERVTFVSSLSAPRKVGESDTCC